MDEMAEDKSYVYLPKVASGDGSCRLYQWLVGDCWKVQKGQPIAKVLRLDFNSIEVIEAPKRDRDWET